MRTGTGVFFGAAFGCMTWLLLSGRDTQSIGLLGFAVGFWAAVNAVEQYFLPSGRHT